MNTTHQSARRHQVVIIGGGFGGLNAARSLKNAPVDIKLIDRRNFHLFQPLLYQVAGGALSPANIASPLRHIFARQKNCQTLLASVTGIAPDRNVIITDEGEIRYDTLIVAAGARHSYFGNDQWAEFAPGLKTVEDATSIRARILMAFEDAELEPDPAIRRKLLTFVIVGGGPTGVELAGALGEIAGRSLKHEFRNINPSEANILLLEGADRLLLPFPPELSERAKQSLERAGVQVRINTKVIDIQADHVKIQFDGKEEIIETSTILWAAGVQASSIGKKIAEEVGTPTDRAGRVMVEPNMSLPGHPEILVIGDTANFSHQGDRPLPGVAPVAIQQGQYVGKLIKARLKGKPEPEFKYWNKGNLATIGKWSAVADLGLFKVSGVIAWLLWLVVHLMYIAAFRNRVLVVIQWGWNFLTNDRSARLITGDDQLRAASAQHQRDATISQTK
ncbi:NAD(P)/FAD-dependent oxidoreductase [Planctomicrobium sp. SH668]|uniref:NAD(P)/FAD-dependent oxidoreductase n=1 Tax=Planctomicrobium sp. SH668 TaxID=3448126 RepID=UPI003F5B7ED6